MATQRKDKPRFASLFCGCGGFDLGFKKAGFLPVVAFDIDPVVVDVYRSQLKAKAQVRDLSVEFPAGGSLDGLDVLLAGPPCQGFSTVGKREYGDPRNKLLVTTGELAVVLSPKVLVVENVAGAASGKHGYYWRKLHRIVRSGGYRTTEMLCHASHFGVAQTRKRLILLAWKGSEVALPEPMSSGRPTLKKALLGLNGTPNHEKRMLPLGSRAALIAKHIGEGQKLTNSRGGTSAVHTWQIPEVFGRTNRTERRVLTALLRLRRRNRRREVGDADPVSARTISTEIGSPVADTLRGLIKRGYVRKVDKHYDLTHTFNGKYRRLNWDAPSPAVDTRFGDPTCFLHPAEARGFTVREAARIQGFPDSFEFSGSLRDQFQMIGNAVPPPLAEQLARYVRKGLLKR